MNVHSCGSESAQGNCTMLALFFFVPHAVEHNARVSIYKEPMESDHVLLL